MTNLKNAPYFIMSGPAKYILSLEKADPSANTYSFQYKYDKNETNSLLSFTFNTPDTSLSFQSAENTLQAKGVIRNTEDDKSLEASLDIDGIKHFDTVMSLKKQDIKFGYVWLPHAYWVVNDERIAELSALLNVNPKSKDILVSGALYYPPGTQLFVDAQLNMSLPTLHDCTIKAKVHEKMPNEFQEKRMFDAVLNLSNTSSTASLSFQSAENTLQAKGVIRNTEDDKSLEASLDIDGIKHFDTVMSLKKQDIKFGYVWLPHAYWVVNDERIAELSATHLTISKPRPVRMEFQFEEGEYNEDKYRMLLRYVLLSEQNFTTYVELDANDKAYSRWATPQQKRLSAAFNWDANRDPLAEGHMRRITNCMLVVNVTSPVSEAVHMTARFGFVEADRHLVAMFGIAVLFVDNGKGLLDVLKDKFQHEKNTNEDIFIENFDTTAQVTLDTLYYPTVTFHAHLMKSYAEMTNTLNLLFATAVWRPYPDRHVRFTGRSALHLVLPPSDVALLYSVEGSQRLLTADINCDTSHYSLRADQRPVLLSVALSTPHDNFRNMKIIGEIEGDDIHGSLVTDTTEYGVAGRVLNRDPLEMSLVLTPKGSGEQMTVRVKSESTDTTYSLSAHFTGPVQATLHANAEVEANFTDISFKMLLLESLFDGNATLTWTSEAGEHRTVDNQLEYKWDVNGSHLVDYTLATPMYEGDATFLLNNLDELSDNKVDLFWLNNTATINTTHTFEKQPGGFRQAGRAAISVPLSTQHLVTTHYLYIQGTANITHYLYGSFKKILGKSARGLDLATTDIEVVNDRVPVGVQYIHEFDASGNTNQS
ncbi:hypothetical protein MSG28_012726 [Choristoneura fumiferana]|uniref:Uncharacterized protein n=1 Tax=Choristoneura fumiferana TaxID=7141 RepID=A0ACC0JI11_CHOFU|nr:hypothetical protein MSG28_012726 [Choristoneura fumiferana]